jgi:hypothetical protein
MPQCFDQPPWRHHQPLPDHLTISHNPCQGEDCKQLINTIRNTHHSQANQLLIYCRGTGPNPTQVHPVWTGAATTFRRGREVGSQATPLGPNTSHKDATFCTLLDAVELTRHILTTPPANSATIYTVNHQILPWCMSTKRHDNTLTCKAICESLTMILFDHPDTNISISWIPGMTGILPLNHILEVASTVAAMADLMGQDTPPTIAALREKAKH